MDYSLNQDPIRLERFEIHGYQSVGTGLLDNVLRVLAAFNALQVLSEWADESFIAQVQIHAIGKQPIDRSKYETSVLMSLEEEDIDVAEIVEGGE